MNARNILCWVGGLAAYAALVFVGNSQPITFERAARPPWAVVWRRVPLRTS